MQCLPSISSIDRYQASTSHPIQALADTSTKCLSVAWSSTEHDGVQTSIGLRRLHDACPVQFWCLFACVDKGRAAWYHLPDFKLTEAKQGSYLHRMTLTRNYLRCTREGRVIHLKGIEAYVQLKWGNHQGKFSVAGKHIKGQEGSLYVLLLNWGSQITGRQLRKNIRQSKRNIRRYDSLTNVLTHRIAAYMEPVYFVKTYIWPNY